MKLETYYSPKEQREMIRKTKKKMDDDYRKDKELKRKKKAYKKRRKISLNKRTSLGGKGMGVSAQGGIKNFLGMLHK